MSAPSSISRDLAAHLLTRWFIGDSRTDYEEQEAPASIDAIAATIDEVLLPRLKAHADALERAIDATWDLTP